MQCCPLLVCVWGRLLSVDIKKVESLCCKVCWRLLRALRSDRILVDDADVCVCVCVCVEERELVCH
jgi:hypothetical protein